ncbi:hypothetical protein [Halopseudomonas xiamenensis]|uniref:hypothetical protein n=1 Tax=Halopseudomonas xiamenensis TaxID=157792 RepID=UPI0016262B73|nr:hypothetical protein [Halopseudomonas xiamenensis]
MKRPILILSLSVPAFLLAAGLILGSFPENHFPAAGITMSVVATVVTILVSGANASKAWSAQRKGIEPYEPISAKRMKLFSNVTLTSDPYQNIQRQLDELYGKHENLADYVDMRIEQVFNYAQLAHERLTEHEEVTLPMILASQSGIIIAGATLSLAGAVALFAPDQLYEGFSGLIELASQMIISLL